MRKTQEKGVTFIAGQSSTCSRSTSYWLALHDLWLYFFTSHNDVTARLMADIAEADVFLSRNARGTVLQISHADSRQWKFEFEDSAKAVKFHFAIREGQSALRTGESIFMKPPRSVPQKPFGYACLER